jgi:hypothetical protein
MTTNAIVMPIPAHAPLPSPLTLVGDITVIVVADEAPLVLPVDDEPVELAEDLAGLVSKGHVVGTAPALEVTLKRPLFSPPLTGSEKPHRRSNHMLTRNGISLPRT